MKKISIFIFFIILNCAKISAQEKVLFIGNSLTFFNDMPSMFGEIAKAKGKDIEIEQHTPGGTGFIHHVDNSAVYNLFASQKWDAVVLQPGSGESAGVTSSAEQTIQRGLRLIDSIRTHSPCAKIILYEISNGIAPDGNGNGNYDNYFATQTKIRDTIAKIAEGMQLPFAPAGECFRNYYETNPDLLLHNSYNDIHPSPAGSYMVACAIFNTLYQTELQPLNFYSDLDIQTAINLQNISDNIVLPDMQQWFINTFNLHADFSYTIDGMNIQLQNLSTNYDLLDWNINDEFNTDEVSPNYTFSETGTKFINLTAYKNNCEDKNSKEIKIIPSNLKEEYAKSLKISPNPVQNFIYLNTENIDEISFSIFKITGEKIIDNQKLLSSFINVEFLKSGTYILSLKQRGIIKNFKFIKVES